MATTTAQVYELLGMLATRFSALDRNVKLLLHRLKGVADHEELIRMIEELTFNNAIQGCLKAAKNRFAQEPDRLAEVTALLDRVDKMRERRNLFLHGLWAVHDDLLPTIIIVEYKMRFNEERQLFDHLVTTQIDRDSLRTNLEGVAKLMDEVLRFRDTIPEAATG